MIEVKGVRKSFSDKEIIKGIDAKFEQGKCNMIIGASGTGKSVLLKNIVGLVRPDSGAVFYDRILQLCNVINDQENCRLPGDRRKNNRLKIEKEGVQVSEDLMNRIKSSVA